MAGRTVALSVIAGASVEAVALLCAVPAAGRRDGALPVVFLGAALLLAAWAAIGWAWWLTGGAAG